MTDTGYRLDPRDLQAALEALSTNGNEAYIVGELSKFTGVRPGPGEFHDIQFTVRIRGREID